MAEAEEVLADVARHATVYARDFWRRHRQRTAEASVELADVASRVELLITTVFGVSYPIRVAEPPAPPTMLTALFGRRRGPVRRQPVPATDGTSLWLPANLGIADPQEALRTYRTMGLQQAMRAERGSASVLRELDSPLECDLYLIVEACAADAALADLLPGTAAPLHALRAAVLAARPSLSAFPAYARPLESLLRDILKSNCGRPPDAALRTRSPAQSVGAARRLAQQFTASAAYPRIRRMSLLYPDLWTGEFRTPSPGPDVPASGLAGGPDDREPVMPRSARLTRRPKMREAAEDEDSDTKQSGAWMVQADEPHEKAEDPMGLQRPTDRDEHESADQLGDMLSELKEARLVSTPGTPREVLLSDDPPDTRAKLNAVARAGSGEKLSYPEWNYRADAYRNPGALVRCLDPVPGPQAWVDATLAEHRSMLETIRRRFEMLQARRVVLRKQVDGEDIDLERCIDAIADLRAGAHMPETLYRTSRAIERNMAILLLIDVSGSTDGWVSASRRTIDVEREALLLVCIALKEMREPYSVLAFSGESRTDVTVRSIKRFDETFDNPVALRIASLEPERYTRVGAAIRHATALLMQQPANHRLLLLLSDGKPNDVDEYEGRYGVEDTYRAVTEARLQGVFPFCLTIDRRAAAYLPRIFGANQYAMLPRPELLPTVLLDWMRRLLASRLL
jgi:nitric oxide reductase NorD protein